MKRAANGTAYDFHLALDGNGAAQTIVLLHGVGLCRQLWCDHLQALTQNYNVLNYDLFGHGDSVPLSEEASLSVYARQLKDIMDELEIDKVAFVGFSIGGMINRRFALDYPERLNALLILNSPHERTPEAQVALEERAALVESEGVMSTMDAAMLRWFTPEFLEKNRAKAELVRDWRRLLDMKSYAAAYWVLTTGVTELIRPAKAIATPSLVITCQNDSGSTPAMAYDIANEINCEIICEMEADKRSTETMIIPRFQHLGLMESPKVYTDAILKFLDKILL